jgi:peptide/nickel transport system substrate-binding protein
MLVDITGMVDTERPTRRQLLASTAGVGSLVVLAGCSGQDNDGGGDGNGAGDGNGGDGDGNGGGGSGEMGPPVSSTFHTYNPGFDPIQYDMYTLIIDELESIGVQVDHVTGPFPQIVGATLRNHDFQMFPTGIGASLSRLDPDEFLYDFLHSDNAETSNFMEFTDDAYDEAVTAQRTTFDEEARRQQVYEAQRIQVEQAPLITFATTSTIAAYRSDRFRNPTLVAGLGLHGFWSHLTIEPVGGAERLRFVKTTDVGNLNPLLGPSLDLWTYDLIYDKLMQYDPETLRPTPWVAESVETVDDTTIVATLRDDVTWHDGEQLTAADVQFSYEYLREHSPTYGSRIAVIDDMETAGDREVTFSLARPFAPIFGRIFASAPLLPEHVWSGVPGDVDVDAATDWQNPDPVGSGPFRFESWQRQEELRLTRFEDYFRPANVPAVSHVTAADTSGAIRFLEGGSADALGLVNIPPSSVDRLQSADNITVDVTDTHGPNFLGFQTSRQPGSDPAFRRAVAHLIPRQTIVDTVLGGFGTVENGSIITSGNAAWHNPDLPERRYDPDRAREILTEAGYAWDDDGVLHYPA